MFVCTYFTWEFPSVMLSAVACGSQHMPPSNA